MPKLKPPTVWDFIQSALPKGLVKFIFWAIGIVMVVWAIGKLIWLTIRTSYRRPSLPAFYVPAIAATVQWGWRWGLAAGLACVIGYSVFWVHRVVNDGSARGVRQILRGLWRWWKLRRRIPAVLAETGIVSRTEKAIPPVANWRITSRGVIARVNIGAISKSEEHLFKAVADMQSGMHLDRLRPEKISSGIVDLHMEYGFHLRKLIGLEHVPMPSHPEKVAVGVTEFGGPLEFAWRYSILVGGVTGSGKSSFIWAYIAGLLLAGVPFRLRIVDPDGVVFAMFAHLPDGSIILRTYEKRYRELGLVKEAGRRGGASAAAAADEAISAAGSFWRTVRDDLKARLDQMGRQQVFTWNPSATHPLDLTVVDELLPFAKQMAEQGVAHPMARLSLAGRKAAFAGVAATQYGLADTLGPYRDLTPQKACFKTSTPQMTDTILGPGSEALGAKCSALDLMLDRGVCWTRLDGIGLAAGRVAFVTEDQAQVLATGQIPDLTAATVSDTPRAVYHVHDSSAEIGECGMPGRLLYVGSTKREPKVRLAEHERKGTGGTTDAAYDPERFHSEWWPDQDQGFLEEWRQITRWQPPYNDQGTNHAGRRGQRQAEEIPF